MKIAVALFCLVVCAVAAQESRISRLNKIPAALHRFGIKGGQKIKIEKRPYTVAILTTNGHYLGTGVLIKENWLLTAGVNVWIQSEVQVRVGSENAVEGGTVYESSKVVVHPKYTGQWPYDIALIKLSKPVKVGPKTKPVSLATSLPKAGAKTSVTGYGGTTYSIETDGILRDATVPFIPHNVCAKKYQHTQEEFETQHFCASKPGVGACPLDWGDPLVYNGKLIGLFCGSLGDCDSAATPGVYLDVTQFREWIKDTIKP